MFVTVTLLVTAITFVYVYLAWYSNYWTKRGVPGPPPRLLLGNFPSFILRNRPFVDDFQEVYDKYRSKGNVIGVFNGRQPAVLVIKPELIKDVLIKNFKQFQDNEFADSVSKDSDPIFGRNPFMLKGEEWKEKRAEVTPAFTTSRMKALFPFVEDVSNRMKQYITQHNTKGPLETRELCAKYTTDVVSSCIFAADAQSFTKEKAEIREMGRKLLEPNFRIVIMFLLIGLIPALKKLIKVSFVSKEIEQFFTDLMEKAVAYREQHDVKRVDYLDHLMALRAKKQLSSLDMAAHGVTFFIDGFETSSLAMCFTLYELAKTPDCQGTLRDELMAARNEDGTIDYDALLELPYLDQVLNEALRIWPPGAFLSKVCTVPTELEVTEGRKIKKMLLILFGSVVAFGALVYIFLTWEFGFWEKYGVKGPKPKILLGNIPYLLTKKRHMVYNYDQIYNDYKNEPAVGYFSIRSPQLLVRDPELIKEVLSKSFHNFAANDFSDTVDEKSDPLLARNPFSLSGEKWKTRRAEITPGFTNNRIKAMAHLMDAVCDHMSDYLRNQAKSNNGVAALDAKEVMAKYTTDVVASCIFAIDAQSFVKENPEIRLMGKRIMNFNFVVQLALLVTTFFPSVKKFYKFTFIPKDTEQFFIRIMQDAISYRKKNKINRTDFLDHLLQLQDRKQITDIDIAGHGVSFFADGFETSSIVLTYCLFDLAKHTAIQQELRDEIVKAKELGGGTMPYEQLVEMALLEQIICETMRIHPLLAVMAKRCTADTTLVGPKDQKIFVKKGTTVVLPYYSISFDSDHFAEPHKYDPSRFSPENGGSKVYRERGIYFPFGDGPRMCLGMRFALTQVKRAIVEIVEHFSICVNSKTIEPFEMDPDQFMLMPKGSIWLDFKPTA
uniref:Cytochrome P450 n=1 Tax=Anopheles christyi TaxID=43041 RepID=A0A182JVP2_9DIPT